MEISSLINLVSFLDFYKKILIFGLCCLLDIRPDKTVLERNSHIQPYINLSKFLKTDEKSTRFLVIDSDSDKNRLLQVLNPFMMMIFLIYQHLTNRWWRTNTKDLFIQLLFLPFILSVTKLCFKADRAVAFIGHLVQCKRFLKKFFKSAIKI